MASITSLSNSSYSASSIYGNRNVLSGLASGMDTETMIENAVSGIKLKIQNLVKKRTKVEWQQEAYRSIIDKAVNFSTKYTSYSSKTNLLSQSFFNNAVNTTTNGTYKDKITASGRTTSDVKINAVKQMATAASYTVSGMAGKFSGEVLGIDGGEKFSISGTIPVSTVSGRLSFQYGGSNGTTFNISFDELENLNEVEVKDQWGNVKKNPTNAERLAQAINNKLADVTYSYTKNGFNETTTAGEAIKATANSDGTISFSDGLGNGNKITISSASGNIRSAFDLYGSDNSTIDVGDTRLTRQMERYNYLSDKELGVTFNGTTKQISMADVLSRAGAKTSNDGFVKALNAELSEAFGEGKVTASMKDGKLSFGTSGKGDTLSLGGSAVDAMGFESGDSNFINSSKKVKDLAPDVFSPDNVLKAVGAVRTGSNGKLIDSAGNNVKLLTDDSGKAVKDELGNNIYARVDSDGKTLYDFKVNGTNINVNEDTTLESLMNSINSTPEAGVKVSYSKLTNEFKFTASETGSNGKIEFGGMAKDLFGDTALGAVSGEEKVSDILGGFKYGTGNNFKMTIGGKEFTMQVDETDTIDDIEKMSVLLTWDNMGNPDSGLTLDQVNYKVDFDKDTNELVITGPDGKSVDYSYDSGLAKDLFGRLENRASAFTEGQDAVMDVEINGVRFEDLTRSSNSFDIDGLTVNVKGTFTTGVDENGNPEEPVTFNTTTDSDKIVETIREFVNDYNEMITEIKNQYSTQPLTDSKKNQYEPLTAEEEDGYSESELKAYYEKAKTGILFGDTTLSSMYSKLLNAIQPGGTDGQALREIGIGTSYSSGLTTLSLDEDKLRAALDSDPDKVKNAFTKTKEGGSSTDGLMQTMQNTLNTYVKTTGEPKGVLIQRAGSAKAYTSLNNNSLKSQIDSIDNQIDRWTDKMADQIDRYTTQFTRLEQLIAEMNSQASAMSGLMGGNSGY